MVKDWGMSDKVGLRTMENTAKSFSAEQLGPSTSEQVRIIYMIFIFSGSLAYF